MCKYDKVHSPSLSVRPENFLFGGNLSLVGAILQQPTIISQNKNETRRTNKQNYTSYFIDNDYGSIV